MEELTVNIITQGAYKRQAVVKTADKNYASGEYGVGLSSVKRLLQKVLPFKIQTIA